MQLFGMQEAYVTINYEMLSYYAKMLISYIWYYGLTATLTCLR